MSLNSGGAPVCAPRLTTLGLGTAAPPCLSGPQPASAIHAAYPSARRNDLFEYFRIMMRYWHYIMPAARPPLCDRPITNPGGLVFGTNLLLTSSFPGRTY